MRHQTRTASVRPPELGDRDGLAYSLWAPQAPRAGIVILHGAGSRKENHHDFARAAVADGIAAVAFDQRGHGASQGPMDGRAIEDVGTIARLLRSRAGDPALPIALRGSSMGGYLAIVAAGAAGASAVIAICPAGGEGLRQALRAGHLAFDADVEALGRLLSSHDLNDAVASLAVPLLLLHAEGDERVPVALSRELALQATNPRSKLIVVPGGHHRSVQHDAELQAISLRWLTAALGL